MKAKLVCLLLLFSALAQGAEQGLVGESSAGSVQIRLAVPRLVSLSGVSDITLAQQAAHGDVTGSSPLCLWSSSRSASLSIVPADGGVFQLANGKTTLPYSVSVQDGSSIRSVSPGQAVQGLQAGPADSRCKSGPSATTLLVRISAADYEAATSGIYAGTLNLVAAPD